MSTTPDNGNGRIIVVGNDVSNADEILDARLRGKGKDKIEALIEEAIATQS